MYLAMALAMCLAAVLVRATQRIFHDFARRWLRYTPSHVALAGKNAAPWCEGKDRAIEAKRASCIAKVGAEPFDRASPRFCWPSSTCDRPGGSSRAVARTAH